MKQNANMILKVTYQREIFDWIIFISIFYTEVPTKSYLYIQTQFFHLSNFLSP